ncbi:Queuine tRNA-ribosyltransferase [Porphyridium purpureum]|uniref:Queuine tRNA-ribosyltransferase n=1 Tax=Porphyridium purpureum TaxID=35688 RepID=A0A5J4YPB6_PORPP|nr:Queuine tRNA-ribosyltransferase [Porphyridium purpureum]|eukprot:POR0733..scf222_8
MMIRRMHHMRHVGGSSSCIAVVYQQRFASDTRVPARFSRDARECRARSFSTPSARAGQDARPDSASSAEGDGLGSDQTATHGEKGELRLNGQQVPIDMDMFFKQDRAEKYRWKYIGSRNPDAPPASEFPAYEPKDFFKFEVLYQSKKSMARVGRIHTPHGIVDTPGYVAVGTNAALKGVDHRVADRDAGMQLMFANTLHMLFHPGPGVVQAAGGLHKFMNRQMPIITDSGGFQIFSLNHGSVHSEINMKSGKSKYKKPLLEGVNEYGARIRSYRDNRLMIITPENSVLAQKAFGADIIIPLDELPPYHISREALEKSVAMTHRWEARSLRTHLDQINQQAMFGVIHGGIDRELRRRSVDYITSLPFDGFAVGGSLGKDRDELITLLEFVMQQLPRDKPCHLLGIADLESIEQAIPWGVDTFDSCFPTRSGRHGNLFTRRGVINLLRGRYKSCHEYPDEDPAWRCGDFTLSYLHHLMRAPEQLGPSLATLHNINHMNRSMQLYRERILAGEI